MGLLKLALTLALRDIPVLALAGVVEVTVGGVVSIKVLVVKLQVWVAANALPARS